MNQKNLKKTAPALPAPPESIGPYSIVRSIGRGGMGEVFLARDPACGRELALKRVRPDLAQNSTILSRFLREARVASQLCHPSIIPILHIESTPPDVYYTMPYVQGDTLRQLLRLAQEAHVSGQIGSSSSMSIPYLARIFLQVCEAIAYTHSKGILHRDIKPENIIVGRYGEVMILDWGIADFISELERGKNDPVNIQLPQDGKDLTRPGKIAGTLAYMAPERLLGESSSPQADLYALGVLLYYMLTLQLPFQRKTLAAFRKMATSERLIDPIEAAPYRDIPHQLASVCRKCLAFSPDERYKSVEELIGEIKNYVEGKAEWIPIASLNPNQPHDWQFQENILLAKHIAITRDFDEPEWAALMISRKSFASNVKLEAKIRLHPGCHGIGLLLSIATLEDRRMLEEGYCLWLTNAEAKLYRNNVLVFSAPCPFGFSQWKQLRLEKVEDIIRLYIQNTQIFSYASHLPLPGAHVGLLHKDSAFDIDSIDVFDASHNASVRCLAVPNAFLSHRLYDLAIQEYRRIGHSFPGRQEGREALFRAGIALLEKGKAQKNKQLKEQCFDKALKEFSSLYRTSGAPLEYLGKSLVYNAMDDSEEEAKCLELALRKFPKHPLLPILKDHIVYRMHESSQTARTAAYRIILLAIRNIPNLLENHDTKSLINSLQRNLELLSFLEKMEDSLSCTAIQLAFWLASPSVLGEIASNLAKRTLADPSLHLSSAIENSLFCLLELDATSELEKQLGAIDPAALSTQGRAYLQAALKGTFPVKLEVTSRKEARLVCHFLRKSLIARNDKQSEKISAIGLKTSWTPEDAPSVHALVAWHYLLKKDWKAAGRIFEPYTEEMLNQEISPLHFAYGCWLYAAKGPEKAQAHFAGVLDSRYPSTPALPSHFLIGRINGKKGWIDQAFWWEKKELHRQLDFFYQVIGKRKPIQSL